jgi:hypothetical protein
MNRICSKCNISKDLQKEYYKNYERYARQCKSCIKEKERNTSSAKLHGVSQNQFIAMFNAQGGLCAICHKPQPHKRLCIDHCHTTGQLRQLLCSNCNVGIGMLGSADNCLAAYNYLQEHASP